MPTLLLLLLACVQLATPSQALTGDLDTPPHIVLIVSDDAGWADFSFQGSDTISTPHLDSIALNGVRFTQGYVTASVCSPSRAGLLTGRYQQRFGHEHNFPSGAEEWVGLPTSERTLADALRAQGYRTMGFGKWHLGYGEALAPNQRGFDEWFGFLAGSRSYWPGKTNPRSRLHRNSEPVEENFNYMTDLLGEEAAESMTRSADHPFFVFLSFTAVHTPMHALDEDLESVDETTDRKRRKLVAMTVALDRAVGRVLEALRAQELERNTLLIFVNDNGGAWTNASSNAPLRGTKGTPYEGGIRVPFLMQWPGVLPAHTVYEQPVSTLDLFATALAAAGGQPAEATPALDGVDLLPFLTANDARADAPRPHDVLFWRRKQNSAVRMGDWKLVTFQGGAPQLFDMANDPNETTDLAAKHPEVIAQLNARYDDWASELVPPAWSSSAVDPKPDR